MKTTIALIILLVSSVSHASHVLTKSDVKAKHFASCDLGDNTFKLECVPVDVIETKQCIPFMKKHFNLDATFVDESRHELSVDELCAL